MPVSDLDIYRSAKALLDKHGERAEIEAAMMYDEMTARADLEGRQVWGRIISAIKSLDGSAPNEVGH